MTRDIDGKTVANLDVTLTEFASREKNCFQTNSEIFLIASVIFVAQSNIVLN
jgi:hypothetical protein